MNATYETCKALSFMEACGSRPEIGGLPCLGRWGAPASRGGLQVSQGLEGKVEREMDGPIGAVSVVAVPTCDPFCAEIVLHTSVMTSSG